MIRDLSKKGKSKAGDKEATVAESGSESQGTVSGDPDFAVPGPVILSISSGSLSSGDADTADANNNW